MESLYFTMSDRKQCCILGLIGFLSSSKSFMCEDASDLVKDNSVSFSHRLI